MNNTLFREWEVYKLINILKSEFYKLKKTKHLLISIILVAVIAVLQIVLIEVLFNMLASMMDERRSQMFLAIKDALNLTGSGCLFEIGENDAFTPFVIIISALVVTNEFSCGSMKNILARGISRNYIVISKTIISAFSAVVLFIVYQVMLSITATFVSGWGDMGKSLGQFITDCLLVEVLNIILVVLLSVFASFISFTTKRVSLSIAIPLALALLLPNVIQILNSMVQMALSWLDIRYIWLPTFLLTSCNIIHTNTAWIVGITGVAEIILFTLISMLIFRKSEIK